MADEVLTPEQQILAADKPNAIEAKVISWSERIMNSTKRLLFAIAVCSSLSFCFGYSMKRGIDSNIADIIKTVIWATGVAYTGGRFSESWEKKA
jgi:hypothetical protein